MTTTFKDFREKWIAENPDKFIKIENYIANFGYYCHCAKCTWSDGCTVEDLVNYVDNSKGNFGGRLENVQKNEDGTQTGRVIVYFD